MQPVPQVSPDGKYWWDGQSWQVPPTVAAAPKVDVGGALGPVRSRQVAGAVALWAVLVIGIGTIALGAIVLADLLNPHHPKSVTAAPGVFLIVVGAVVALPAVVPSRWLTRHASAVSVEMSWARWMLWAVLVLGFGIAALGMIGLLDLLNPNHSKTLTAAPSLLVMGLGGLAILGPTLKLLGLGLSISGSAQVSRSATFSRPLSRSDRARKKLALRFGVLGFVAVIIGTARQGGFGWALVAGLAMAVAFGIPVGIAWAIGRRTGQDPARKPEPIGSLSPNALTPAVPEAPQFNDTMTQGPSPEEPAPSWLASPPTGSQQQQPTLAVPPPPATLTGSIIVRPTPFYRWGPPIVLLVMAGAFLSNAYQNYLQGGLGNSWFSWALGLIAIGLAVLSPTGYIRVDDSTIFFGPNLPLPLHRTFDRRDVALIRATSAPMSSRTLFLRSDGSTLWSTPGVVWGEAGLRSLADYLGVPYER